MPDAPDSKDACKLWDFVCRVRVGMMTALHDGLLRGCPVVCVDMDRRGALLLFTRADRDATARPVALNFLDRAANDYVSLSGTAEAVHNPDRVRALWNEELCAWFSQGPEDPDLALLRVQVAEAEFWDSPSSDEVGAHGLVKLVADETPALTENRKLVFAQAP